jgi:hypothetical protein
MTIQQVSDMNMDDLRAFVEAIVEQHLSKIESFRQEGSRPVTEILASMKANLWTPPANGQSALQMLREDRDR